MEGGGGEGEGRGRRAQFKRKQSGPIVVDAFVYVYLCRCLHALFVNGGCCWLVYVCAGFLEHINYYYKNIVVNIETRTTLRTVAAIRCQCAVCHHE